MSDHPAVYVVVGGIRWDLFSVDYEHDDKHFSFYIYAKNRKHAEQMVEDIRSGATLNPDTIIGFSANEPTIEDMEACKAPPVYH